jgi:hypothetical protein
MQRTCKTAMIINQTYYEFNHTSIILFFKPLLMLKLKIELNIFTFFKFFFINFRQTKIQLGVFSFFCVSSHFLLYGEYSLNLLFKLFRGKK